MIREDVSRALNLLVPEDGWDKKFAELDEVGRLDMRTMWKLVLILLKHVEKLEDEAAKRP